MTKNYKMISEEEFAKLATTYCETFNNGNYKLGNRMYKEIHKLVKDSHDDDEFIQLIIVSSLYSDNYYAQYLAAIWLLLIKKFTKESLNVLKKLSLRDDIGITKLNSEMTLKTWKKQGFLKL